jgi:hypothetical protein
VLERDIERRLARYVKARGGLALKFTSPSARGVPDRLIVLPGGDVWFAELKAPGKRPTPQQARMIRRLRALQATVLVLDSVAAVDEVFLLEDSP